MMTAPEPQPEDRLQNLTGAATVVLVIAVVSTIFLGILAIGRPSSEPRGVAPFILFVPHLLIVALLAAGFRMLGDFVALITAVPAMVLFGLMGLLAGLGGTGDQGMDGGALVFALMQGAMFFVAITDLIANRKLDYQVVPVVKRLLGLGVPLGTYLIAWGVMTAAVKGDQKRVEAKALDAKLEARASAARWLSNSSLDNVVRLARCVEESRGDSVAGPAPRSLSALRDWSVSMKTDPYSCGRRLYQRPDNNGSGQPLDTLPHPYEYDVHHVVYYEPPADRHDDPFRAARFTLGIEAVWDSAEFPNALGNPGTRSYLLDPDGNIHVTSERRRATASDPIVPVCGPRQYSTDARECRPPFESRQRWGMVSAVSRFWLSTSGNLTLPDSLLAIVRFDQVNALDSVRSVTIDWGEGHPPTLVNLPPTRSFSRMVEADGKRYRQLDIELLLWHRYRQPGSKVVGARLVTRAGAQYFKADTVFVKKADAK